MDSASQASASQPSPGQDNGGQDNGGQDNGGQDNGGQDNGSQTSVTQTRPGWHAWGVGIAYAVAQRADCTRRRVGAVIFDEANRILSTGYNGAPAGRLGCLDGGCPRGALRHDELPPDAPYEDPNSPGFCISIHAESNALLFADPVRRRAGWIAITHPPCPGCQKLLSNSGLAMAVWPSPAGAPVEWTIGESLPR